MGDTEYLRCIEDDPHRRPPFSALSIIALGAFLAALLWAVIGFANFTGEGVPVTNLDLIIQSSKSQALSGRDQMIVDNLPLITKVCAKSGVPMSDDALSAGILGLIKAVDAFKPELGHQFSTFAFYCIRNAVWESAKADWKHASRCLPIEEALTGSEQEPRYEDESAMVRLGVKRALEAMHETDRRVVEMYFFKGLNLREIASRLRVSHQRVHQCLQRGLLSARRQAA